MSNIVEFPNHDLPTLITEGVWVDVRTSMFWSFDENPRFVGIFERIAEAGEEVREGVPLAGDCIVAQEICHADRAEGLIVGGTVYIPITVTLNVARQVLSPGMIFSIEYLGMVNHKNKRMRTYNMRVLLPNKK